MANNVKQNDEQVIRLDDILYIVLKHRKVMLMFAIIGIMVGLLISFAMYVRGVATVEYYVTASMAVTSTNQNGLFGTDSSNPNAQDIHLAEDMTDAVIYVCKSDKALNAASERLKLIGVTAEDIKPRLILTRYEETQIIEMTLNWDNAEEGKMILEAITEVVPPILIDTLKIGDVTIVNAPKVRTNSMSFINVKIVAICLLLGVVVSAGFYLVNFFIHPTYLHSEDIKEAYNLDVLGEIPGDTNYFSTKVNSFSANDFSSVQEYFSACAHVLVYRLQDIDNVCVYVTSSASQEGKSSITANLAYALSELGYKTLLMDMDVRNPSLASKFVYGKDDVHTLNAIYRGDLDVMDAIVKINSNLDIIPTILEEERLRLDYKMVEIISKAKENYDFVLIDTAPVGQVSDSMSLNQAADCALFVVRQDQVWITTVTESISRLKKSGIAILGAIMNDTKTGSSNYYYQNYKQFGESPYVYFKDERKPKKQKKETKNASDKSIGEEILKKRNKGKEEKIEDKPEEIINKDSEEKNQEVENTETNASENKDEE